MDRTLIPLFRRTRLSVQNYSRNENYSVEEITTNRRDAIQRISCTSFFLGSLPWMTSQDSFAAYIDPTTDMPVITKRVYLDVQIPGEETPQRIIIGLFGNNLPRVVDNFVRLCEGLVLDRSYAGTSFYRILSDMTIQGGAIGDDSGKTGLSSFGEGMEFEPDNFNIKHTREGLVSMVRANPNGGVDSRFFINTKNDAGWADGRYAAFGIVEEGMDIVHKIENVKVQRPQNSPVTPIKIIASGVLSSAK